MDYATISLETKNAQLADAILMREHEVHAYQINIDNYTVMLAALPSTWPDDLVQFKNLNSDQIATSVPEDRVAEVADLAYADRLRKLLVTEQIEQNRARRVREAMIAQLPVDQIDALIKTAVERAATQV